MKTILCLPILTLLLTFNAFAQTAGDPPEIVKIEAQPSKGFSYPYYLYVPKAFRETVNSAKIHSFLVIPNNTGKIDDDLKAHDDYAKRQIDRNRALVTKLDVAILMPVFPRPKTDWKIYTHALDRDSMLTDKKEYAHFDRQLVAMIDHARSTLKRAKIKMDKRVLIMGFSASGMFANRFTFLHPTRVKAAAVGSPGGWPIAPITTYEEKTLRYPIGTGDFKSLSGRAFDLKSLRKVPIFVFLGDQDDNDSVVFGDGYETEDKDLVFELFGKTPVERWEISKKLYADSKLQAEFKLYPGVKHTINQEMFNDISAFLAKHSAATMNR